MDRPESTVRDACKKAGTTELRICREDNAEMLAMLKETQAVSQFTSKVSIIQMYDAAKLIRRLGSPDVAKELDQLRQTTQPPPIRHLRRGPQAPAAQPAPPAEPAPPPPVQYTFPSSIPEVFLTPSQQVERYAMSDPQAGVLLELGTYLQWCQAPVNTERSSRYIKAAQSTTLEKVPSLVMAFMGATRAHFQLQQADISLDMYKDPKYMARFIG